MNSSQEPLVGSVRVNLQISQVEGMTKLGWAEIQIKGL